MNPSAGPSAPTLTKTKRNRHGRFSGPRTTLTHQTAVARAPPHPERGPRTAAVHHTSPVAAVKNEVTELQVPRPQSNVLNSNPDPPSQDLPIQERKSPPVSQKSNVSTGEDDQWKIDLLCHLTPPNDEQFIASEECRKLIDRLVFLPEEDDLANKAFFALQQCRELKRLGLVIHPSRHQHQDSFPYLGKLLSKLPIGLQDLCLHNEHWSPESFKQFIADKFGPNAYSDYIIRLDGVTLEPPPRKKHKPTPMPLPEEYFGIPRVHPKQNHSSLTTTTSTGTADHWDQLQGSAVKVEDSKPSTHPDFQQPPMTVSPPELNNQMQDEEIDVLLQHPLIDINEKPGTSEPMDSQWSQNDCDVRQNSSASPKTKVPRAGFLKKGWNKLWGRTTMATTVDSTAIAGLKMESPRDNDVLLGKSKEVFEHPGNQHFRDYISENLSRWTVSKQRKRFSERALNEIKSYGVRFLKKNEDGLYELVDDSRALRKIAETFTNKQTAEKKKAMKAAADKEAMEDEVYE